MKVVSVNVGLPQEVVHRGRNVYTGIFKKPVQGRVRVGVLNLEGDRQADLRVHGGPHKAVYAYPVEHYDYWVQKLESDGFPLGQFGENLTVEGLLEDQVFVGDTFRIGSALLQVSQPRTPCYKLDIIMGVDDFRSPFTASGRTGFYLRVLEEGALSAGDAIKCTAHDPASLSVCEIFALRYGKEKPDVARLRRAADTEGLAPSWRDAFAKMLAA